MTGTEMERRQRPRDSSDPPQGLAVVDGALVPLHEARVPVTDRAFLLGDSVFETMRTYDGRIAGVADHRQRLAASLHTAAFPTRPALAEVDAGLRLLQRELVQASRRHDATEWVVRVCVSRGDGQHGLAFAAGASPRVVLLARPFQAPTTPPLMHVATSSRTRAPPSHLEPNVKSGSCLGLVMARHAATEAGCDEALVRDPQGSFIEGTSANLFVQRKNGSFLAPGPAQGALPGTTRAWLMAHLLAHGHSVHEAAVSEQDLAESMQVWLTQTTTGLNVVRSIDGRRMPAAQGQEPDATALFHAFHQARRAEALDGTQESTVGAEGGAGRR